MDRRRAHLILGVLLAVSSGLVIGSCTDDTAGPGRMRQAQFAIIPSFQNAAAGIVPLARARFIVTRAGSGTVVKDTTIALATGQDSVDLSLQVAYVDPTRPFLVEIRLLMADGTIAYRGGPVEVSPAATAGTPIPVNVTFIYEGPGAAATSVVITEPVPSLLQGNTVQISAVVLQGTNPVPAVPLGWESLDPARATVNAVSTSYVATVLAGAQRGNARIVVTTPTGLADTVLVAVQPLPSAIVAESGSGQTATVGTALPQPLVARITAPDGQGVSGLQVSFAVTAGGGSVSVTNATTDAQGRASTVATLGLAAGAQTVTATTPLLASASATFTSTATPGVPENVVISTGSGQTGTVGSPVAVPPAVLVTDANANPVAGVDVAFEVVAGGGALTGAAPVTNASGIATLGSWTLGNVPGANQLRAFLPGFAGMAGGGGATEDTRGAAEAGEAVRTAPTEVDSGRRPRGPETADLVAAPTDTVMFTATAVAGAPAALVLVSGDAQTGTVGAALVDSLVVRVEDALGNPIGGTTVDWAVTLGNGTVNSATVTTDGMGLAAVAWTLGTAAGTGHAVTASVTGVPSTAVYTATALPGAPAALAFVTQPTGALANAVITPAIEVEILDGFGNRVTTDNTTTVDIAITAGTGTPGAVLAGTLTQTAVSGLATFGDLAIDLAGTGYTLDAQIPSLTLVTSASFDIGAPGIVSWIDAAGGMWTDGANWSTGSPPGPTDTALIDLVGTYTVTVDTDPTVAKIEVGAASGAQTVDATGRAVTAPAGGEVLTNGTLILDAGTFSGNLVVDGLLQLDDGTINGLVTIDPTGVLLAGGPVAAVNGNVINNGTVNVSNLASGQANFTVTGTVNIAVGASLTQADPGTLALGLANDGLVTIQGATTLDQADAEHTNTGTFVVSGGNLTVTQTGTAPTFTTTGTIVIEAGRQMLVSGGAFAYDGGTLDGDGTLFFINNAVATFTPSFTTDSLDLSLTLGGVLDGPGTITNSPTSAVLVGGASSSATFNADLINQGLLTLRNSTLNGALTTTATSVVLNSGVSTVAGGFTNNGVVNIDVNFAGPATLTVNGTLTNASGASVNGIPPTSTLDAVLDNQGIVIGPLTLTRASAAHVNSATIDLTAGGMTVVQSGTSPSFSSSGTITIGTGQTLTVTGGTFTNASGGTIEGTGTLDVTGTAFTTNGAMNPGTSPGILAVLGNTTWGTSAVLNAELGGTVPGTGYDRLATSGTVQLAGTLDVTLFGGFTPTAGDLFAIMTFGSATGAFATVNLPDISPLLWDTVSVTDTLYLVANGPPPTTVIAGWSATRSGLFSVSAGTGTTEMRASLSSAFPGVAFVGLDALTTAGLAGADIVVIGPNFNNTIAIAPLTSAEQTALVTFVLGGGCAVIPADNNTVPAANTSLLTPFGMAADGLISGSATATVTDPASSPVTDGPFGTVATFTQNFPGFISVLGPNAVPLATNASGPALAVIPSDALGSGSGPVIVFSDENAFADAGQQGFYSANEVLWRNTISACLTGVPVPVPPGTEAVWTGAVSTDWFAVGNWDTGVVPDATTNVFIPGGPANQPVVSATTATDFLILGTGASVTVNGGVTLTVNGDLDAGNSIGGAGTVLMQVGGSTVSGTFPNLTITDSITAVGPLTVNGNLTVTGPGVGGNNVLTVNGNTVDVTGNLVVGPTGFGGTRLADGDSLIVAGDVTYGGGNTVDRLTGGVLQFGGNFSQVNTPDAYAPTGTHVLALAGTGTQTFTMANPNSSPLNDVVIVKPSGTVTLATNATIGGDLATVPGVAVTVPGGLTLTVSGNLDASASPITGTGVLFKNGDGSTVLGTFANLSVGDDVIMAGNVNVTGNLIVQQGADGAGNQLTVNGFVAAVGGNFSTGPTFASPVMADGDTLIIAGDATFAGGSTLGRLSGGAILVSGNFTQGGGQPDGYNPTGTHTLVLEGTGAQSVSMANPNSSPLQNLDITNTLGTVDFPISATINGVLTLTTGATTTISGGATVTVFGDLDATEGIGGAGILRKRTANGTVRGTFSNLTVTDSVVMSGDITVSGNLVIDGSGGGSTNSLDLNGFVATVGGDFTTGPGAAGSPIIMTGDTLIVGGDATFAGGGTAGRMAGGAMLLSGDLTQAGGATNAYDPTGTHTLVLEGTGTQTVSLANPGSSTAQNIEITNTTGVVFASNVTGSGQLIVPSAASVNLHGDGNTLTVAGFDVDGLEIDSLPLISTGGAITRFDNVTFDSYDVLSTQLTISHPGAPTAFAFNNTVFNTTPTTGLYVDATDLTPGPDPDVFTIDFVGSSPLDGSGFTATSGGAVVNWPLSAPPGTEAIWTGSVSGDWSNVGNWDTGAIPDDTTNVFIPVGTPNAPSLSTAAAVDTLVIGTGVTVDLAGFTLTVSGDLEAGATITGPGTVVMTGTGMQLQGVVPDLDIQGRTLLTGRVTVNGNVTLTANLDLQGNAMDVSGNFTTPEFTNGVLIQHDPLDSLIVAGNVDFTALDAGLADTALTAGVIVVAGTFSEDGDGASFNPSATGSHKVVLNGAAPQTLNTVNVPTAAFRFLEITGTGGVTALTPIDVSADLTVASGSTFDIGATTLTVGGNLDAGTTITGTTGTVVMNGTNALLQGNVPSLDIQGRTLLNGRVLVSGDVTLTANLDLQGNTMEVTGTFTTPEFTNGVLIQHDPLDSLIVAGDISFTALDAGLADTALTDGVIVARANFSEDGDGASFAPSAAGNHKVVFDAVGAQTVSLVNGPTATFRFVEVMNTADVTAVNPVDVTGDLTVDDNGIYDPGSSITDVQGNFSTLGAGALRMTTPLAQLVVGGNATFGGGSVDGLVIDGAVTIAGDFTQSGNAESFHAGGSNSVVFNGIGTQTITFANPGIGVGADLSHFANVAFNGAGPFVLGSDAFAHSNLISDAAFAPTIVGNGNVLAVGGLAIDDITFDRVLLEWNGTVDFPSFGTFVQFDNVTFQNYLAADVQLTVVHPGFGSPFAFTNTAFLTPPTSPGLYIDATDALVDANTLTINLSGSSPGDGSGFTTTTGGAIVNWPAQPAVLVSHWAGDGDATDSADGNDGTLIGGTTFAPGLINQAFRFDGLDDQVTVGNPANLQLSTGTFSVSAWVFIDALGGDMSIADKMSGLNVDGWRLGLAQATGGFLFCLGDAGNGCQSGIATTVQTAPVGAGVWIHVAAVKTTDSIAIYLDGVLAQQKPLPAFTDNQANDLLIGATATTGLSAFMDGEIDDLRIFNGALTATEIDSIFNAVVVPAQPIVWIDPAGGAWNDPANWGGGVVPGAGDTAVIDLAGAYTVSVPTPEIVTVSALFLGGPGASPTVDIQAFSELAITDTANVAAGATMVLNNTGRISGAGVLTVDGTLSWFGGTMSGTGLTRIESGGSLTLTGGDTKSLETRNLTNLGAASWADAGGISGSFGSTILNEVGGTFDVSSTGSFNPFNPPTTFVNNGTFTRVGNAFATTIAADFTSTGIVDVQQGTLSFASVSAAGAWSGTISVALGAVLEFAAGTYTWNDGLTLSGPVIFRAPVSVTIPDGTVSMTGDLTLAGGTLTIQTSDAGAATTFSVDGTIANPGGTIALENSSSAAQDATLTVTTGALTNGGALVTSGTATGGGTRIIDAAVTNQGTLSVVEPLVFAGGSLTSEAGAVVDGGSTLDVLAITFINDGAINPGTSPGILAVNDDVADGANAALNIEIGGTLAGTDYDRLEVSGNFARDGALTLTLINGFTPAVNDSFAILTSGSQTGEFASVAFPVLTPPFAMDTVTRLGGASPDTLVAFVFDSTPPPPVAPNQGLIAWWPGDGDATDIQGGRDGTLVGGATFGTGKVDQAFSFSGADEVTVPDDALWTFGDAPFTVELWVNLNSLAGVTDPFVGHTEGANNVNKWVFGRTAGALRFHVNSPGLGPTDILSLGWTPTLGQWYHLAVTRNGSSYVLYIDGAQVATGSDPLTIPDAAAPLTIGRAEAFNLDGLLDEVTIYDVALSAGDIQAIYDAGVSGKDKALAPVTTVNAWTDGGGGLWSDAANWSLGRAPTSNDSAVVALSGPYTVTVDADAAVDYLTVDPSAGTVTVTHAANALSISSVGTFGPNVVYDLSGGSLDGAGTVSIEGTFNWTGGTMLGAGTTRLEAGATATFAGGTKALSARSLENATTLSWTAGTINVSNGAAITNEATGTFDMLNGLIMNNAGGVTPSFVNLGTFQKRVGAGSGTIGFSFDNDGTTDVQVGQLQIDGGGGHAGQFIVNGTLLVNGGTHTFDGDVTGTGWVRFSTPSAAVAAVYTIPRTSIESGSVNFTLPSTVTIGDSLRVTSGTVFLNTGGIIPIPFVEHIGGTITGTSTLQIADSLIWDGGVHGGNGTTEILGSALVRIQGGTHTVAQRTFDLAGSALWTAGDIDLQSGTNFTIQGTGSLDVQDDLDFISLGGSVPTITNAGTFLKSGGIGSAGIAVSAFVNDGTLDIQSGALAPAADFTHNAGAVLQGTGALDVSAATVLAFDGDVNPGTSPGVLTVVGPLPQGALGTLNIEIGGTTVGTEYDRLNVSGPATLDGALNVALINGFSPAVGDSFAVMTFASQTGTFAGGVTLPDVSPFQMGMVVKDGGGGPDTLVAFVAPANLNAWTGLAGDGLWSSTGNWSRGTIPAVGDSVVIGLSGTYTVTLDISSTVAYLDLGAATGTQTLSQTNVPLQINSLMTVGPNANYSVTGPDALIFGGAGDLQIDGTFTWGGGSFQGTGAIAVASTGTLLMTGGVKGLSRNMQMDGTGTYDTGVFHMGSSATLTVGTTGQYSVAGDLQIIVTDTDGSIVNNGLFLKTAGAGTASLVPSAGPLTFTNNGLVDVQVGTLTFGGGLTNNDTLEVDASAVLDIDGTLVHNASALARGDGTLNLTGATVTAFDGDLAPGTSPGLLSIVGNLPQDLSSIYTVELDGPGAGTGYDQLAVSGTATLDGALDLVAGFTPVPGDSFTVLAFGTRAGTGPSVTGLDLGGGTVLDTIFTATELILNTTKFVATGSFPVGIDIDASRDLVYVANNASSDVTVIDATTNTVSSTVPLAGSSGLFIPAVNETTNKIYVSDLLTGDVFVIDGSVPTGLTSVGVGNSPGFVTVDESTNRIYVPAVDAGVALALVPIDGTADTVLIADTVHIGTSLDAGLGIAQLRDSVYVARNDGSLVIVDLIAKAVANTINVGTGPYGVAANSVTDKIYVANETDGTVTVFNVGTGGTATVTVGSFPEGLVVDETRNLIFVSDALGSAVSVIDGSTDTVVGTVEVGSSPTDVTVHPSTGVIYVPVFGPDEVYIAFPIIP